MSRNSINSNYKEKTLIGFYIPVHVCNVIAIVMASQYIFETTLCRHAQETRKDRIRKFVVNVNYLPGQRIDIKRSMASCVCLKYYSFPTIV